MRKLQVGQADADADADADPDDGDGDDDVMIAGSRFGKGPGANRPKLGLEFFPKIRKIFGGPV